MTQTATLLGIAYRKASRAPMQTLDTCQVTQAQGVHSDYRGRAKKALANERLTNKRQVTLMCAEKWQAACEQLGMELPWTTRRANLLLSGIDLGSKHVGQTVQVGEAQFKIVMETDPCFRMDELQDGLKAALMPDWRGGVCCTVVRPGRIALNDAVMLVD